MRLTGREQPIIESLQNALVRRARTLEIDRKTLYSKLERYGLEA